jgi:nifR3 family TIM-barrel protein
MMTEISDSKPNRYAEPWHIGQVAIHSRVLLAPMAGVTDMVFRDMVRDWAPDSLICTEMISSNGIVYSKRFDAPILDKARNDHPIAYQLAANREEVLIKAATTIIEEKQPDTIDLNMGCPVKKITGNFEGCALMKEPDHARKLISALVKALEPYKTPVTVKFRLGWDSNSINYKEFGLMCEESGAQMVTLHARTRAQGYQPGCKWEAFGELKQHLSIPVVANGDIVSLDDARHVLDTYGVEGVMIGRGCQGQPWLIGHMDQSLKASKPMPEIPLAMRLDAAWQHSLGLAAYKGEEHGLREMRRHLPCYVKGFYGASSYRSALTQVSTLDEVRTLLDTILDQATADPLHESVPESIAV